MKEVADHGAHGGLVALKQRGLHGVARLEHVDIDTHTGGLVHRRLPHLWPEQLALGPIRTDAGFDVRGALLNNTLYGAFIIAVPLL